ncbi:MAG TPA: acetyl-CoA C-acyltransferase, partial [Anaeromyxobacteraceae bacterium]|nr:acetyl-CoA C-acyltransferase [Anaeromyxobacteraceae bacterium]
MRSAFLLGAVRTAGTRARKGGFRDTRPDDLAAAVIRGVLARTGVAPDRVEDVVLGCAFPEAEQGANVARIAALRAGLPVSVPAMTVNRLCSSGLQAIAIAAERILAGAADCVVAGGVESMTMVPMWGGKFSPNPGLEGSWPEVYASMGITAELVAQKYGVSRADQDAFAALSHARAAMAIAAGKFKEEILPVEVETREVVGGALQKGTRTIDADDGVRRETTPESLAKLKPVFAAQGTVTAGNCSQMTDGAAAVLVVSEECLRSLGREPMARFLSFAVRGVPPELMGIGPIEAIPAAVKKAGVRKDDLAAIELNEAFASQSLAIIRSLGISPARVNPNGGAIALG